jgi:hypothetical protein
VRAKRQAGAGSAPCHEAAFSRNDRGRYTGKRSAAQSAVTWSEPRSRASQAAVSRFKLRSWAGKGRGAGLRDSVPAGMSSALRGLGAGRSSVTVGGAALDSDDGSGRYGQYGIRGPERKVRDVKSQIITEER